MANQEAKGLGGESTFALGDPRRKPIATETNGIPQKQHPEHDKSMTKQRKSRKESIRNSSLFSKRETGIEPATLSLEG